MRRLLFCVFVGAIFGVFGCKQQKPDDEWTVAAGSDNGFPLIVRMRTAIPAGIDTVQYSHLMAITWKYTPETNGMPSKAESARMDEFEHVIGVGIEAAREAVMATAVTCNGIREWHLYAKDETAFMKALNTSLIGHPSYPIEIAHRIDPQWTAWRNFAQSMKR